MSAFLKLVSPHLLYVDVFPLSGRSSRLACAVLCWSSVHGYKAITGLVHCYSFSPFWVCAVYWSLTSVHLPQCTEITWFLQVIPKSLDNGFHASQTESCLHLLIDLHIYWAPTMFKTFGFCSRRHWAELIKFWPSWILCFRPTEGRNNTIK